MNLVGFYLRSSTGTLHEALNKTKFRQTKCGRNLKEATYTISPGSVKAFCSRCGLTEEKVFDPRQWEFNSIGLPAEIEWKGVLST